MEDDDAVREQLLAPNAERLTALLQELDGKVQLTVKGTYAEDALLRDVVAGSPAIADAARARPGASPSRPATTSASASASWSPPRCERRREDDTARVARAARRRLPSSVREEAASGADAAFNLAFLVERARAWTRSAEPSATWWSELGDRVAIRYVGPLAPYSFADAELEDRLMGLFTGLLTLPLAPVRGTVWLARAAAGAGRARALRRPPRSRRSWLELEAARETGEYDEAEIEQAEDALIERLMELRGFAGGEHGAACNGKPVGGRAGPGGH